MKGIKLWFTMFVRFDRVNKIKFVSPIGFCVTHCVTHQILCRPLCHQFEPYTIHVRSNNFLDEKFAPEGYEVKEGDEGGGH